MASTVAKKKPLTGLGTGSPERDAAIAKLAVTLQPIKVDVSLRVQ